METNPKPIATYVAVRFSFLLSGPFTSPKNKKNKSQVTRKADDELMSRKDDTKSEVRLTKDSSFARPVISF